MRVYQFRHVGTGAALYYCVSLLIYYFCYYSGLESFAPDELSFHAAHPLSCCCYSFATFPPFDQRETRIIEDYSHMSNAAAHYF